MNKILFDILFVSIAIFIDAHTMTQYINKIGIKIKIRIARGIFLYVQLLNILENINSIKNSTIKSPPIIIYFNYNIITFVMSTKNTSIYFLLTNLLGYSMLALERSYD